MGFVSSVFVVLLMFLVKGPTSFQVLPVKVGSLVQDTSDKGELLFRIFPMKGLLRSGVTCPACSCCVRVVGVNRLYLAGVNRYSPKRRTLTVGSVKGYSRVVFLFRGISVLQVLRVAHSVTGLLPEGVGCVARVWHLLGTCWALVGHMMFALSLLLVVFGQFMFVSCLVGLWRRV